MTEAGGLMVEPEHDWRPRLLRGVGDELVERLRTLAELTRGAGASTLDAIPGSLPAAAVDVLTSLRGLVEQAPPPTAAVDLFLEEVKAKRAMVQALQVQLTSFEAQLDVLERSLAPLQAWGRQWSAVQGGLADALNLRRDDPTPPDGAGGATGEP